MKVILLNTMSVNGMISLENGNEGFLSDEGGDYVTQKAKEFGNIIWGRRAYDNVRDNLTKFNKMLESVYRVIVSSNSNLQLSPGYELATTPQEAIKLVEKQDLETALLDGGGKLNASFLRAGLVDEVHLIMEPVLVGRGLPIIAPEDYEIRTSLLSVEQIHDGEVLVKYKVEKKGS